MIKKYYTKDFLTGTPGFILTSIAIVLSKSTKLRNTLLKVDSIFPRYNFSFDRFGLLSQIQMSKSPMIVCSFFRTIMPFNPALLEDTSKYLKDKIE